MINSSVFMQSEPTETTSLKTKSLFGETVDILKDTSDRVYCELNTNSYRGWIKKGELGKVKKSTHRVFVKRSFIIIIYKSLY